MNLIEALEYLHDKLTKVDEVKLNLYLLRAIKLYIKSGCTNTTWLEEIKIELGRVKDNARINKWGKDMKALCRDIDVTYAAAEFFYAHLTIHATKGTPQEKNVFKFQSARADKAKVMLDTL